FTQPLPFSIIPKLEAVPGVARVSHSQWFGGIWKKDNQQIFVFVIDPQREKDVYPEIVMPEEQWQAFANTRNSVIAGKMHADKYGWKIGDMVPISSDIFPQKNGSKDWTFQLVGIWDGIDEDWKKRTNLSFINRDYFNEANGF